MHSLAVAISGKTGKLDRSTRHMSIDADTRDGGEIIEPRAPASLDELERLLTERPLEELERLLREHSVGSAARTPSEGLLPKQRFDGYSRIP